MWLRKWYMYIVYINDNSNGLHIEWGCHQMEIRKNCFRFVHWRWKTSPNWYTVVEWLVYCDKLKHVQNRYTYCRFKGMHTIWLDIHFPPWVEFTQQHQLAEPFSIHDFPKTPTSPSRNMRVAWVCMFCISVSQFSHGFSKVTPGLVQGQNANVSVRLHAFPQHIDRCPGCPTEFPPTRCCRPTLRSPYKDPAMHFLCGVLTDRFGEIVTQQCPYL